MFPVPNLLSLDPNTVVTRLRQSIGLDSANNAAPPASTDAISRLERRKVGCDMPGPSSMEDCTVCLEKMANGEDVVLLPCEHQFHELCGVDWLKRRNRCPNCRSSIQERTHYLVGEC
ncbi:hypothetical protein EV126DRAFT_342175 [Verticillium dahliae]|nr:hypothetical protein EV126DRAFT_342175 [Verticillium dahliae]